MNKKTDSVFSPKQHEARKAIFAENLKFIKKHNAEYEAGLQTFTVGVNRFADITNEEFALQSNGLMMSSSYEKKHHHYHHHDNGIDLPTEVDWRAKVPLQVTVLF